MPGGGSKPGERRGGRQKGSKNLSGRELRASIQEHGGDLVTGLMAIFNDPKQPADYRIRAARGTVKANKYGRFSALNPAERGSNS
jgi:hypothetical protein